MTFYSKNEEISNLKARKKQKHICKGNDSMLQCTEETVAMKQILNNDPGISCCSLLLKLYEQR